MGFRFWVTEDTKCHSFIFTIFLNLNLPLVICTVDNAILAKQTRRKMKEGSMHDEQMKSVLKNNASAVMSITVHYLHFALVPMETEIL